MKIPIYTSVQTRPQHFLSPYAECRHSAYGDKKCWGRVCTSVVSVFIQVQNLVSSENGWKSLNSSRPRVVLTRNHKF